MGLADFVNKYRDNRRILLLIVYIALFLDNMLLTTVGKLSLSLSSFLTLSLSAKHTLICGSWVLVTYLPTTFRARLCSKRL